MTNRSRILLTAVLLAVATFAAPGLAGAQQTETGDSCSFPYSATDATGTEVTVQSTPDSAVVLQPSGAQTMWDIGARDQVVAMPQTQYTGYLNDTGDRPNVKNADGSVNVEVVTNTSADIVLAANATQVETVQQLRQAGMTVYHFDRATSIEDVYEQVSQIGRLTGNCQSATQTVSSMRSTVKSVEQSVDGRENPRVLYYFFEYTTGSNTHIHDLIQTAGGTNIAAEAGLVGYDRVNTELVVSRDPQWIVYPSDATVPRSAPYNSTTALERNQTLSVNYNYVSQPGPRIVRPLVTMAHAFHPQAFADENASAPDQRTNDTGDAGTDEADAPGTARGSASVTETTGESGPGFTVAGGLVAALSLAVLALRRH